jgi:transcriptional regulator
MYVPAHFRESRAEVLHEFIERHPLATLVVRTASGLDANHIPMELQVPGDGTARLRGHVARANPVWQQALAGEPVLAIFTGPQHYVTPSWYPSKQRHGKVVPTWNYSAVHAEGHIRFVEDAPWVRVLVGSLTDAHEGRRAAPWKVEDAPEDYVAAMLRAIVGFEIEVSSLVGKFKASQNREAADREGVATGLAETGIGGDDLQELLR